ncbi:MAG: hypothetical protein AAFY56_20825 [Pseudomonadota bacterium]
MRIILVVCLLVIVLGGSIFLITWDIPPPIREVEYVVPEDRMPQ